MAMRRSCAMDRPAFPNRESFPIIGTMSSVPWLSRRPIHRGRVLDIGIERVRLPNGVDTDLEIVRHPGAAAVVPINADGSVLLIRQYRYAAGGFLWEIPAGTLEPGEEPSACALRELIEEAGVRAGELVALGEIVPVPGYSTERIHLFAARALEPANQKLDRDELIEEIRTVPAEQVERMLLDGTLIDGKSCVALSRARERGLLAPGCPTPTR
jgi:ADP-ribose pyrophosphatase